MLTRIVAKLALAMVPKPMIPMMADQCHLYFTGCLRSAAVPSGLKAGGQKQASNSSSITMLEMQNKENWNKLFYKAFGFHRIRLTT